MLIKEYSWRVNRGIPTKREFCHPVQTPLAVENRTSSPSYKNKIFSDLLSFEAEKNSPSNSIFITYYLLLALYNQIRQK